MYFYFEIVIINTPHKRMSGKKRQLVKMENMEMDETLSKQQEVIQQLQDRQTFIDSKIDAISANLDKNVKDVLEFSGVFENYLTSLNDVTEIKEMVCKLMEKTMTEEEVRKIVTEMLDKQMKSLVQNDQNQELTQMGGGEEGAVSAEVSGAIVVSQDQPKNIKTLLDMVAANKHVDEAVTNYANHIWDTHLVPAAKSGHKRAIVTIDTTNKFRVISKLKSMGLAVTENVLPSQNWTDKPILTELFIQW